jgi:hypothetical protein
VRRGVAPAVVALADRRRAPRRAAGQRVDQRRLADAGRAEQHAGHARSQPGGERVESCSGVHADRQHRHGGAEREPDVGDARRRVGVEVGLGEHHDGVRAGVGGEREHALEPAHAEVAVERAEDERDVDVRGQHLRLGPAAGRGARDPAAARQHGMHDPAGRVDRDPVTDGGQVDGRCRGMAKAAGERSGDRPAGGEQVEPAAVGGGDAGGDEVLAFERCEFRGAIWVPPEGGERVQLRAPGGRAHGRAPGITGRWRADQRISRSASGGGSVQMSIASRQRHSRPA